MAHLSDAPGLVTVLSGPTLDSRRIGPFATLGQEAFLEGLSAHIRRPGSIPVDKLRSGNLMSVLARVMFGRNRLESDRWVAFRSHHRFDAF